MIQEPTAKIDPPKSAWPSLPGGAILLLVLTLLVYYPSLSGGFIWDDDVLLTENPTIKAGAGEAMATFWASSQQPDYLPLTMTSLWLEWRLWGLNAAGYRLTNIFLHAASAVLLWRILRRLQIPGAFFSGLVFAVHPVCVASVAWIAERKNTLSMVFFLLSIFWWLRREEPAAAEPKVRHPWFGLSLGSFFLALFSKGSVVILPGVLLLLAWWRRGRVERSDVAKSALYFVAALVFGLATIWFQFHRSSGEQVIDQLGWLDKVLAAAGAMVFYFFKAIWPTNLAMIYPAGKIETGGWAVYAPLAGIIGVIVLNQRHRQTWGRAADFALAYFFIALLPVLGFIDMYFLTYSRVADHWQYLAIIGIIGLGVSGAAQFFYARPTTAEEGNGGNRENRQRLGDLLALGTILALGTMTWQRSDIMVHSEKLWRDTLTKNPECWAAHMHLGDIVAKEGKLDAAKAHFSAALALKPNLADAHFNLGNTLATQGDAEGAATHFLEAIRCRPRHPGAHYNLGLVRQKQEQWEEALQCYFATLQLQPNHVGAHNNLGNLLSQFEQYDDAIAHYKKALQLNPNQPEVHNNLANNLQRQGKIAEALPHYFQAIALDSNYADAHNNLATGLEALGRTEEAQAHRRRAEELQASR